MTVNFYHDERCMWHTTGEAVIVAPVGGWVQPPAGGGHAESPESKRRFRNLLEVSGLDVPVLSAPPVTREDLLRVHPASYIDEFKRLSDAGGGEIGMTAPFGKGSFEIAAISAGLAKQAVLDVASGAASRAYALSRPPGHHCEADMPKGFCLLANIPIAVEAAQAAGLAEKVLVIDWDVHHGNGAQEIYYERGDVHTLSIHQENHWPPDYCGEADRGRGAGEGANTNIPLPAGCGHVAYQYAVEKIVVPVIHAFQPDLVIIACGLDASQVDPLANMACTSDTFRDMTRLVCDAADQVCGGKVVAVHEGGYSEGYVPFCGLAVMEGLTGQRTEVIDPFNEKFLLQQPRAETLAFQKARIDALAAVLL